MISIASSFWTQAISSEVVLYASPIYFWGFSASECPFYCRKDGFCELNPGYSTKTFCTKARPWKKDLQTCIRFRCEIWFSDRLTYSGLFERKKLALFLNFLKIPTTWVLFRPVLPIPSTFSAAVWWWYWVSFHILSVRVKKPAQVPVEYNLVLFYCRQK